MREEIAAAINTLGRFCGMRDVPALTAADLRLCCGIDRADIMVLFGGSLPCGGDVLAQAMKNSAAQTYIIVGGAGHTTDSLREKMRGWIPGVDTFSLTEAELFEAYLERRHNLKADYLERRSTNCGNNITYLLELLRARGISFHSIILSQDATMQHRMAATLRRHVPLDTLIVNYATYAASVSVRDSQLVYDEEIPGMWDMERYITLLLGEIPRLSDTPDGYGPCGKNYLAHVDIPAEVSDAFLLLKANFPHLLRPADPQYASPAI